MLDIFKGLIYNVYIKPIETESGMENKMVMIVRNKQLRSNQIMVNANSVVRFGYAICKPNPESGLFESIPQVTTHAYEGTPSQVYGMIKLDKVYQDACNNPDWYVNRQYWILVNGEFKAIDSRYGHQWMREIVVWGEKEYEVNLV